MTEQIYGSCMIPPFFITFPLFFRRYLSENYPFCCSKKYFLLSLMLLFTVQKQFFHSFHGCPAFSAGLFL